MPKLRILVANHRLDSIGGTENYTYALIAELLKQGHSVEYFTNIKGFVSQKAEELGVKFMTAENIGDDRYDLILANHNTCIEQLFGFGFIIQTIHGTSHALEEPSCFADFYVSVSKEIQEHLSSMNLYSHLILNGINLERFHSIKPLNEKLCSVLSLCQSDEANSFIEECCKELGIVFNRLNKYNSCEWEIENYINNADLVIGFGRSLYDAMACGRAVMSYDRRYGQNEYEGYGYLNADNLPNAVICNCTGRNAPHCFTKEEFMQELKKYKPEDGISMRCFAEKELNIENAVRKYLSIYEENKYSQETYQAVLLAKLKAINELTRKLSLKDNEIKKLHEQLKWTMSILRKSKESLQKIT